MSESAGLKTASPIFVLGVGRSGTTLLQRLLNTHPEVNIWGEHGGILDAVAQAYFLHFENEVIKKNALFARNPLNQIQHLKNPELWQGWVNWYNQEDVKVLFRRFVDSFFKPDLLKPGIHWGFKEIRYGSSESRALDMIADLYPDARYLVMVRDPVDVAASQAAAWDGSKGVPMRDLAQQWLESYKNYLAFMKRRPAQSLLIRYEDLTLSTDDVLKRLTSFLGLTYTDKGFVLALEKGRGTTRETSGAPRARLSEKDVREIQEITGELSEFFC